MDKLLRRKRVFIIEEVEALKEKFSRTQVNLHSLYKRFPKLKNKNDTILAFYYWAYIDDDIEMQYIVETQKHRLKDLTPAETIRRNRQFLNADGIDLPKKDIREHRDRKEKIMRKASRVK